MIDLSTHLTEPGTRTLITRAPEGYDAHLLADIARSRGGTLLFVARDDVRMARMADALAFFAQELDVLEFPAWDCLPYDRVSPRSDILSARIDTLTRLMMEAVGPRVVLTTVSAALQRVPSRAAFEGGVLVARMGEAHAPESLTAFMDANGYARTDTVMEPGEYAMRGGIMDVFPSGADTPLRLDFFGDDIESIRTFDPTDQRTTGTAGEMVLKPVSEVPLDDAAISRFRSGYRELFGAAKADDVLYESISAGRRHIGMEHWAALFHETMETLFDYVGADAVAVLDHQVEEAVAARLDLITEYYAARLAMGEMETGAAPYNPVPPERLYLSGGDWRGMLADRAVGEMTPFAAPEGTTEAGVVVIDAGGHVGRDFADARVQPGVNVFDVLRDHIEALQGEGLGVVVACFSEGSRERLRTVLGEHGIETDLLDGRALDTVTTGSRPVFAIAGFEHGFRGGGFAVITEQDVLGDRMVRRDRPRIKPENIIAEASQLQDGDYVVHLDHGIGQYAGLETIEVQSAPHDCLRLIYAGGDKLFLPVENIDVISRYGSEDSVAHLDKLGGAAWQARRAHMKARLKDMAEELIKIAAEREMRDGMKIAVEPGAYDEFAARFPYAETDDQLRAITDTIESLGSGRPMDRLVCGDVGFGKTEVALRAAFVAALGGRQVAVVVPTTLLARQHYRNFVERFQGFPVRIAQLSRLVTPKDAKLTKEGLKNGTVDIVIGTHALLAKDVGFRDLGLLIVDEEQHFGVAHKEKLKKLKADVHVLTLTATPIPRTLQLALTGVKDMSLMATPPVDRLAVRTFVMPFDPVITREAIQREQYRGGQTFYVCPRIGDLEEVEETLKELVPDAKVVTVHGRMTPKTLEDRITAFYEGKFDVLLSTNIIESGLDLPAVNTMIIHRADMFGLAQLYQLRGRVGRSKVRAYAYLTLPPKQKLSKAAEKRLEVMQTLDTLGAGFTLASHDLDIRGAGNLLGAEQSGHIREVGIELYQQMLEEAVAEARGGEGGTYVEDWSPQVSIGLPVLIPETYVTDLTVRLGLYRRAAGLASGEESESFAAELIDRFGGPLPEEVENLLATVMLKRLCKQAGVEKVDAGPKGAVVSFRNDQVANIEGLVAFITDQAGTAKLRPDQKLVLKRPWDNVKTRLQGVRHLMEKLAEIAAAANGPR